MKFLISILGIVFVGAAFAQTNRNIYDLMYLPTAGTIYGSTALNANYGKSKTYDEAAKNTLAHNEETAYGASQTVGYSLTNNFFASASINWMKSEVEVENVGPGSNRLKTDELSDPSLELKYRLHEAEWIIDALVGGVFSTSDRKTTSSVTGNDRQVGNSASAGVQLGKKMQESQIAFKALYTKNFERDIKMSGVKIDEKEFSQFYFEGAGLVQLAPQAFLKAFAGVTFQDEHKTKSGEQFETRTIINLGGELQYLLNKDILLRAGVTYQNQENYVVDNIEIREDCLYKGFVAANYQF